MKVFGQNIPRYWIPVFFIASLIFYFSTIPSSSLNPYEFEGAHLIAHILEYSAFGFFINRALTAGRRTEFSLSQYRYAIVLSAAFVLIFGALDEFHQLYTPGRGAKISDVFLDFGAGLFGIALSLIYRRWLAARLQASR